MYQNPTAPTSTHGNAATNAPTISCSVREVTRALPWVPCALVMVVAVAWVVLAVAVAVAVAVVVVHVVVFGSPLMLGRQKSQSGCWLNGGHRVRHVKHNSGHLRRTIS